MNMIGRANFSLPVHYKCAWSQKAFMLVFSQSNKPNQAYLGMWIHHKAEWIVLWVLVSALFFIICPAIWCFVFHFKSTNRKIVFQPFVGAHCIFTAFSLHSPALNLDITLFSSSRYLLHIPIIIYHGKPYITRKLDCSIWEGEEKSWRLNPW